MNTEHKKINDIDDVEYHVHKLLECVYTKSGITDYKNDPNLLDTPRRIAKSWLNERLIGLNSRDRCKQLLSRGFPEVYRGMIIQGPIMVDSMCPHHFENVLYEIYIGMIYKENFVVGLSKIPRVAVL